MVQFLESIKLARLVYHSELGSNDIRLFLVIYDYHYKYRNESNTFFITYDTVQKSLKMSRGTISSSINKLVSINFLKQTKVKEGKKLKCYYSINFDEINKWYTNVYGVISSNAVEEKETVVEETSVAVQEPITETVQEEKVYDVQFIYEQIDTPLKVQKAVEYINSITDNDKMEQEIEKILTLVEKSFVSYYKKNFIWYFRKTINEARGKYTYPNGDENPSILREA